MKRRLLIASGAVAAIVIAFATILYIPNSGLFADAQKPADVVQQSQGSVSDYRPTLPTAVQVLDLVNSERTKAGVAALQLDDRLNQSAQRKADDMVKYDYKEHVSPNDGKHGYEYINDVGISCKTDSENLAWGWGTRSNAQAFVGWWMSSAAHKAALLNGKYTLTGFGTGLMQDGKTIVVVEHFCEA